jgi:UDP-2-acetamido-3-amino-2,3-dideoxy-glucuronate N-acetyltransferase
MSQEEKKDYFVHESAYVDESVQIGKGTRIWHFSHIMKGAQIGENCKIGQSVYIDSDVEIGNNVKIQNNVSVYKKVTLEDGVFCGPSMVFVNVINPRSDYTRRLDEYGKTLVKRGATIGANATVLCGITVGTYAFIGAGAVVTKDVPDYGLVYGNPARIQGWMCECGTKLQFTNDKAECQSCQKRYEKKGEQVNKVK